MMKRPIVGKALSLRWVAVKAKIGAPNASPLRTTTGIMSSASAECTVPKISMTRKNAKADVASLMTSQPISPPSTALTVIGVASMPS